ncbi:MAG TPA: START domain-containing protein [Pseudomonadales bacterium]|nr:START domain-containing protein [Pseudomonadales bacterium]
MSPCFRALAAILLLCAGTCAAAEDAWQLRHDDHGVKVYTRSVPGSRFEAVKATMVITARLAAAIALVRDTAACSEWESLCDHATGIKRVSTHEVYVYQVNNLPWPVSDRDVVAHVLWARDTATGGVTMTATAVPGMVAPRPGMVRVNDAVTRWLFQPLDHGRLRITTEAHIDPGGPMPAWIINMLLVKSPVTSMANLRRIVATGRYDDANLDFLGPANRE